MKKVTVQDIINMAADRYDNQGYTRADIWDYLKAVIAYYDMDVDIARIYDLIVG